MAPSPSRRRMSLLQEQHVLLQNNEKPKNGLKTVLFMQGKTFFLLLGTWILFFLYIRYPRSSNAEIPLDDAASGPLRVMNTTFDLTTFHLLIPASRADPNLCKTVLSAGILGYPAPVIINWETVFDLPEYVDGGSHLAKISGVNDYLKGLDESHDEDLVLMVDGYDIWFQLRPQTLLDRYFAVNKRADQLLNHKLGLTANEHDIHQEIIFGCQKRCWPWTENDPPCYAVPHSSLPEDVYGPDTDTDIGYEENPYIKFRPRFINSGIAMGTVRAMRKLLAQALELLELEKNFGSDQYIFSHILGDQEVWREAVRRDNLTEEQRQLEQKGDFKPKIPFNPQHIEEVRAKAAAREDKNFEFHIGLDYGSEIGLNTVFAEDDMAWLTWSNNESLRDAEDRLDIPPQHSHLTNLSSDITHSVPPFWTFNNDPLLPRWTSWTDVFLFTNVWTGTVPAIIHHNAHRDGRKALREEWWDVIWFQKYARIMYDAWIHEPLIPVAYSEGRAWWPAERWKGGAKNGPKVEGKEGSGGWLGYDDMCKEFGLEVFRDGKGDWLLPESH